MRITADGARVQRAVSLAVAKGAGGAEDRLVTSQPEWLGPDVPARPYGTEGRVPFRVRIGVTGHRTLQDEQRVAEDIAGALRRIRAVFAQRAFTPLRFTIFSALAEGADRLAVHEAFAVLGEEVRVEAVLPRDAGDYMADFGSAASKREFEELLARASAREMPAAVSATEGYERAGRYVVDQSDILLAVWDGQPARGRAGTAEVVAYARSRGRPVVLVKTGLQRERPTDATAPGAPPGLDDALASLRLLERYNAGALNDAPFQRLLAQERGKLDARLDDSPIRAEVEHVAAWSLPRFVRAEVRALRYQRAYHVLGDLLYLLAALAVTAVAAQSVFFPEYKTLVGVEIVCLLMVIVVFLAARVFHVHERWMAYRSLAEAFRSATFIALTGARDRREHEETAEPRAYKEPWYQRVFSESWSRRPRAGAAPADEGALCRFVMQAWLEEQIAYHRARARRCRARHHQITLTVGVLVTAALTVAVLHFLSVGEETNWPKWFAFLAIALPGFGAAVTGIREHRQFRLHGTRSARTAERLQRLRDQVQTRAREVSAQGLAAEIQTIILEESVEWSGVQEFQDLEMVI
jgi:hypothetical protein